MGLFHNIAFRKVLASLLLALFTFIYVEKIFHVHDKAAVISAYTGVEIKSVNNNCAICDFQLAKDSETPVQISTTSSFIVLQKKFAAFSSFYFFPAFSNTYNRGPPVV